MTIPMTKADAKPTFSMINMDIKFEESIHNDRLNDFITMSINRNSMHEINNFDDKVPEKFISMRTVE